VASYPLRLRELMPGRRAAVLTGACDAIFHVPLLTLTTAYQYAGSRWIVAPTVTATHPRSHRCRNRLSSIRCCATVDRRRSVRGSASDTMAPPSYGVWGGLERREPAAGTAPPPATIPSEGREAEVSLRPRHSTQRERQVQAMLPVRLRGIGQGPQPSGELDYLQGRPDTNEGRDERKRPAVRALIDHLSVKIGLDRQAAI